MLSSREGLPRTSSGRRRSMLAGLAVLGLFASTGCQVEYAGMTLPSGKYFQDDVQYFAKGPEFPYANTQAATQRARMQAAGYPTPPPPGAMGGGQGFGVNNPGPAGMPAGPGQAGAGIPRLNAAPEAENTMPGGPSAPNVVTPPLPNGAIVPGTAPAPGGATPPPPQ